MDCSVFLKDDRFFIDKFNYNRIFADLPVKKYEIASIRLGDILMHIEGKNYHLQDTAAYQYLSNTEEATTQYDAYCDKYGKKNKNRSKKSYDDLIEQFEDYDIKKGAIFVNQYNMLLDGQHRSCLMLKKYGPDHVVEVVRVYIAESVLQKVKRLIKGRFHA